MKWKDKVEQFLNNEQLILDIRSGLVLFVSILLPLVYFLYSKNFSISGLLAFQFGILSLIVIFGNVLTFLEISDKAIRDEKDNNKEITTAEQDTVEKQNTLPKKIDRVIDFNRFYNEQEQDNKNKELTDQRIAFLNNKITNCKIKGKPFAKYERETEFLNDNHLYDKTYKPVQLKYILAQDATKDTEIKGNDAIHINPRTYGMRKFLMKQPIKALSIGGSGMFILGLSDDLGTILMFYLIYLISLAVLTAFRYPFVRKITRTLYIRTLKNKQDYIDEFHEWNNNQKEEEINEEDNCIDNGVDTDIDTI